MFLLEFKNAYGEKWLFQNLGAQWPGRPALRLIEMTTQDREKARKFETEEAAKEVLVTAGGPAGWEILEVV